MLRDPATLRQMASMASNPAAMAHAQRGMELQMSQMENMPGGMDAMRRAFTEMGGAEGGIGMGGEGSGGSTTTTTDPANSSTSTGPTDAPLPQAGRQAPHAPLLRAQAPTRYQSFPTDPYGT